RPASGREAAPRRAKSRRRYESDSCARQARHLPSAWPSYRPRDVTQRCEFEREANDALAFGLDHSVGNLAIQRVPLRIKLGESRQRIGGDEERPMPAPSCTLAQRRRVGMEVEDRPVFPET